MIKNIEPVNDKGQKHGYWESYWPNGKLHYKCFWCNGKEVEYEEWYDYNNGKLTEKKYHI